MTQSPQTASANHGMEESNTQNSSSESVSSSQGTATTATATATRRTAGLSGERSSSASAGSHESQQTSAPVRRPGSAPASAFEGKALEVSVDDRGVERAIRRLKRKIDTEGLTKEVKRRRHFEKPSVRKRRKEREAERRRRRRDRRIPGMPAPRRATV